MSVGNCPGIISIYEIGSDFVPEKLEIEVTSYRHFHEIPTETSSLSGYN